MNKPISQVWILATISPNGIYRPMKFLKIGMRSGVHGRLNKRVVTGISKLSIMDFCDDVRDATTYVSIEEARSVIAKLKALHPEYPDYHIIPCPLTLGPLAEE